MNKQFFKKSLGRRIQSSMIQSNILTLFIVMVAMFGLIVMSLQGLTYFITASIANEIVSNYEATSAKGVPKQEGGMVVSENLSLEAFIETLKQKPMDEVMAAEPLMLSRLVAEQTLIVENEHDYKRIIVVAHTALEKAKWLSFEEVGTLNISQVHMTLGSQVLTLPFSNTTETSNEEAGVFKIQNQTIQLLDTTGANVGNIMVEVDGDLFLGIFIAIFGILIFTALVSIFIVKGLSRLLSKNIMKPIHQVNVQLRAMAAQEIEVLETFELKLKKPPVEIESMIAYSNAVLDQFKKMYNTLENQNAELHAQNDELISNRAIIETQQAQLVQSEKMASVGQISAAIIHEINTPIGAIKSNAQLANMVFEQLDENSDYAQTQKKIDKLIQNNAMIITATDRISEIIRSLKHFSRIDQSDFQEANIVDGIDSVLTLTANVWKSRIKVEKAYNATPVIMCYASLLNQVFMNLINNAIDAIPGEGILRIEVDQNDKEAVVKVIDNGTGMDAMVIERIFEQGFTTKPPGKGSGLGLALSHSIVEKHKGYIKVESELGRGSCFEVHLPL